MSETNSEIFDPLEIEQPEELLVDENGSTVDPDGKFNKGTSTKAEQFPLGRQSLETINSNYPSDCYSFLALHGPLEQPKFFFFGVLVWAFQVSFFVLMVLKVAGGKRLSENEEMDNPDNGFLSYFIPSNVSSLGRITQFLALLSYSIFADDSLKDVVTAVETFPSVSKAKEGDKVYCMLFSCLLRFSQGVLATIVVLLLVINTQDVVEIILNFTAVNFISGFDDIAFELTLWGRYGSVFKAEANRIKNLPVPDCLHRKHDHVRYQCTILPLAAALVILLSSIAFGQDSDNIWLTQIMRVQFKDGSLFEDFSGCYQLDTNSTSRTRKRENYVSLHNNAQRATFGYCQTNRKWILHRGNSNDACDILDEERIAYSTKTNYFDISMSFEDLWYSSSGRPLQLYFFDNETDLSEGQCSSFIGDGICNPYFDIAEYDYDEGDCCAASCTDTFCGIDTLTNAFGTDVVTGNGYPNCTDPTMKPITIRLNNVFNPTPTLFASISSTPRGVKEPLMILDCDDKNVLMVSINENMTNQTETVKVADGANCLLGVRNSTVGAGDIWYVDYTVFHGDKDSIVNDPIVMAEGNSYEASVTYFQRIEDCILEKLGDHIDISTVYTGTASSNKAIRWLMQESKHPSCERADFIERYALAVINFAAVADIETPSNDTMQTDEGLWITPGRHCIWSAVGCTGSVVTELNYRALDSRFAGGTIATEIGLLRNLTVMDMNWLSLSGTIPTEIGHLTALTTLGLFNNSLVGSLPTGLGALTQLRSMLINNNRLSGSIPSEIGFMTKLTVLGLYANRLTGSIPSEIGRLTNLENLILDGNFLTRSIPSAVGNMSSLNYFGLSWNGISGRIPTELGSLERLQYILFDNNDLEGSVPEEILDLDLLNLGVYGNRLSNLTEVEGSVVCSSLEGEHYCDCQDHCVITGSIGEPNRCACADGQACCQELYQNFQECIICQDGFVEPNKFIPELRATCAEFSGFIRAGLKQFGSEDACVEVSAYTQAIGCPCIGGSEIKECVVCEYGLENPNHIMETGTTCSLAREYVRNDVSNFGTESKCNEARIDATLSGCICNNDPREEPGEIDLMKCVVCENGLSNPELFLDSIEARCSDAASFIEENIAEFGSPGACDDGRLGLLELGCICNERDLESEKSDPLTNSLDV